MSAKINTSHFKSFIQSFTGLIDQETAEAKILQQGRILLRELIKTDDWLPDTHAQSHPQFYQQHLLYVDPASRFSVVSFVWGPGQITPIHNHTVWGLVGLLRGGEFSQGYELKDGGLIKQGEPSKLIPGDVEAVSPTVGDLHRVSNAFTDKISISIHVYGADIGKVNRSVFLEDGTEKSFISGYSNVEALNLN